MALQRTEEFKRDAVRIVLTSGLTQRQGWLYLAAVLDLHSRRVIGWAVNSGIKRDLEIRALSMAIFEYITASTIRVENILRYSMSPKSGNRFWDKKYAKQTDKASARFRLNATRFSLPFFTGKKCKRQDQYHDQIGQDIVNESFKLT